MANAHPQAGGLLRELLHRGGLSVVSTRAAGGAEVAYASTLIQLDGDVVERIDADALRDPALLEQHHRRVLEAGARLSSLAGKLGRVERALRAATLFARGGLIISCAILVALNGGTLLKGWERPLSTAAGALLFAVALHGVGVLSRWLFARWLSRSLLSKGSLG